MNIFMILLTKVFITNILHWHFTYLLELCTQPLRPHSSTIWGHSKLPTPVILLVTIPAMAAHWHYTTLPRNKVCAAWIRWLASFLHFFPKTMPLPYSVLTSTFSLACLNSPFFWTWGFLYDILSCHSMLWFNLISA